MEHTMSEHGQSSIHKAELLACGCRVDPITGAAFVVCAQHAIPFPAKTDIDIVVLRAPTGALKPLCPFCASQHIVAPQQVVESPASIILDCKDCGCRFKSSEITGYAMSLDSKPTTCPQCNAVVYGACTCGTTGP